MSNAELRARTAAKLEAPDTLEEIVDHVANGGSLIDLCDTWQIRYSDAWKWITADEARRKRYDDAVQARGEWFLQRVLMELRDIGTVDIRELYTSDGSLKPVETWPKETARAVIGLEIEDLYDDAGEKGQKKHIGYTKKVKIADKLRALEMIGKHIKMFTETHEIKGRVTLEDLVAASKKPETPS